MDRRHGIGKANDWVQKQIWCAAKRGFRMKHDPADPPPLDWQTFLLALALVVVPLFWFIVEAL